MKHLPQVNTIRRIAKEIRAKLKQDIDLKSLEKYIKTERDILNTKEDLGENVSDSKYNRLDELENCLYDLEDLHSVLDSML